MTDTLEDLTDTDLTGLLEDDYRRQLRWYPKPWRAAHGEALIGTLLDEADDTDRFTMQRGEWRSFAAAGLTARLDRVVMRPVRDAAATVMLTAGVGVSVACSVISSWAPWGTFQPGTSDRDAAFGPFSDASPVLTALWLIALVCALLDRWWIGRIALLASVVAAVLMRPAEMLIAPPHFFSLHPGALTLSATAAVMAALGTPRTRLPLVAAAAGWAGLSCIAHAYLVLVGGGPADPPTGVLADPVPTSWAIAIVLAVAVVFAIGRFRAAAFTILLSTVPVTAALEAWQLAPGPGYPPASHLLIVAPVSAGLVALVVASRRAADSRGTGAAAARQTTDDRRRSSRAVAIAVPLLVLVGPAGLLTAAGLDWAHPTAVDWRGYWRTSASLPWDDSMEHPDASFTYRLPGGGTCTIRTEVVDTSSGPSPSSAAVIARTYLAAPTAGSTLLSAAHIDGIIEQNPSAQNLASDFWGVPVRYGRGTSNYNADVEYFEAVDAGVRQALIAHVEQAGASKDDFESFSAQRCVGEQQ